MTGSNSKLQQLERDEREAIQEKIEAGEAFGRVSHISNAMENFPVHNAASQRLGRADARLEEIKHQIAVLKSQSE